MFSKLIFTSFMVINIALITTVSVLADDKTTEKKPAKKLAQIKHNHHAKQHDGRHVQITGIYFLGKGKLGNRFHIIETSKELTEKDLNFEGEDGLSILEMRFELEFDKKAFPDMKQYQNKRVMATGVVSYRKIPEAVAQPKLSSLKLKTITLLKE